PDKAVALCRRALQQERSPENLSALAWVLFPDEAARASSEASREALGLAIAAVELRPNDMFTQLTLCRAALAAGDTGWFRRGVLGLERVAPDMAETHYVRALLAGGEGRLDEARRALEEARRRGLSDVQYRGLRDGLDGAQPFTERSLPTALVAVAVWLGGLALLLLLGWALSAITLRASQRAPTEPGAHVRGLEARVRGLYRGVLWLCCAYYYVSIPIVIALVITVAGVVLYAFARLGGVAGKLLALAVIVTLVTLWAIVKSIFARGHDGDPGLRLDLEAHPALGALLRGVAAALGTRPVDTVYMTPG